MALERNFPMIAIQTTDCAFVSSFKLGRLSSFVDSGQNHWESLTVTKTEFIASMLRVNPRILIENNKGARGKVYHEEDDNGR